MAILNWYKDRLDNLIDRLNENRDIEPSAILKQIDKSSNNISSLKNNAKSLKKKSDLSKNRL